MDVVGYFECFDDSPPSHLLCAIGFIFEKGTLYLEAQGEDDSFELHSTDWCGDPRWAPVSFAEKPPWSLAIGKSLLWSWVLHNQQGYFDGIQFEFANNVEDKSTIIQLVAIGSGIDLREVAGAGSPIAFRS